MDAEQKFKNKKNEEQKILAGSVIQKIREEIRNWYGNLSIRELTQNKVLIAEIEKLERLLAGKVAVG
jgi:hypothetical protein